MCNYTYVFTYKYTQHTHIYIKQTQTFFFWMWLIDLTALVETSVITKPLPPLNLTISQYFILPYVYLQYSVHIQDSTE